jgi:hypothetical protein
VLRSRHVRAARACGLPVGGMSGTAARAAERARRAKRACCAAGSGRVRHDSDGEAYPVPCPCPLRFLQTSNHILVWCVYADIRPYAGLMRMQTSSHIWFDVYADIKPYTGLMCVQT